MIDEERIGLSVGSMQGFDIEVEMNHYVEESGHGIIDDTRHVLRIFGRSLDIGILSLLMTFTLIVVLNTRSNMLFSTLDVY